MRVLTGAVRARGAEEQRGPPTFAIAGFSVRLPRGNCGVGFGDVLIGGIGCEVWRWRVGGGRILSGLFWVDGRVIEGIVHMRRRANVVRAHFEM